MDGKYRPPSSSPPKRRQYPRWSNPKKNPTTSTNINPSNHPLSTRATTTATTTTTTATTASYDPTNPNQPLPRPILPQWTDEEAALSPAVNRALAQQKVRHPPLSATLAPVRYNAPTTATNMGPVSVATQSQYGPRRRSFRTGAPPGASPLEPLATSTVSRGTFKPGESVQAFYEPDHSWYDARVVKSIAKRMTKRQKAAMAASSRNTKDKEDLLQSFSTVVVFDDGFPGEHVVEHVRKRKMYPLNLGKSVESNDHGRIRYPGTKGNQYNQTPLQALTPDVLSRLHTPGEKRNFPFKYKVNNGKRSVTGSNAPFTARVSMDVDDTEAHLRLIKKFQDYYFGPKDIVDAAVVNQFKQAVEIKREQQLKKSREPPRPRSALPAGRRVPPSWMKRNRKAFLPKGPRPPSVHGTGKSSKLLTWRDYVWCHMHNWHFAGTGPGVLTKNQYQTLFRAETRSQKKREKLIRDIETISSFRIDLQPIDNMLKLLAERKITRAEAKDRASVAVDKAITGCGRGIAPVSALRGLRVVDSDKAKDTKELRHSLLERMYDAIDDNWGPGDSSGDLGPRLRWNMAHPGVMNVTQHDNIKHDKSSALTKSTISTRSAISTISTKSTTFKKDLSTLVPVTTASLNKHKIKTWSLQKTKNKLPNDISNSTVQLILAGSHFGTGAGSTALSDQLFQSLPHLIVLNLTRCTIDSRSLEGLAVGLTAMAPMRRDEFEIQAGGVVVPRYAAVHLEVLILDSNFVTRGRPMTRARKQKMLREQNKLRMLKMKPQGITAQLTTTTNRHQKNQRTNENGGNNNEATEFFEEDLKGIEALGLAIRKHPRIKILSLRKNALGLDGSRRFIRRLLSTTVYTGSKACPFTLQQLNIASTGASNKGFAATRDLTWDGRNSNGNGCNSVLLSLDVTHNKIDHAGIHSFFEPPPNDLEKPRSLRTLILRHNDLSLLSVQTIVAAVKSKAWRKLRTLDISLCNIGDIGCNLIGNMLQTNHTLTSLNLSSCNLTNNGSKFRGALHLIHVLEHENRTLLDLNLASNTLVQRKHGRFDDDDACGWSLVNLILRNKQIRTLNIKNNAFNMKVRFALKNAVLKAPLAELDKDRKIAFWMCKQKRLGKNSPARVLWYGFLSYITDFLAERRDQGEILY